MAGETTTVSRNAGVAACEKSVRDSWCSVVVRGGVEVHTLHEGAQSASIRGGGGPDIKRKSRGEAHMMVKSDVLVTEAVVRMYADSVADRCDEGRGSV